MYIVCLCCGGPVQVWSDDVLGEDGAYCIRCGWEADWPHYDVIDEEDEEDECA